MDPSRRRFLELTSLATVGLAGCTDGGAGGGGGDGTRMADVDTTVSLVDISFDPTRVTVDPGATVEWVNDDGTAHDVTAAQFHDVAADWDIGTKLGPGERTSHTFERAGVYEYACTIHGKESMCGAVLVGDASLDPDMPCEGGDTTDDGGGGGDDGGYY